ncbi:MAG: hypothetical protein ABL958_00790 [Bdellovibrionia bacterium]
MAKRGRSYFLWFIFLVLVFSAIGVVAALQLAAPKIKQLIERNGSAALGGPVKVASVQVKFWPPGLALTAFQATGFEGGFMAKAPAATATVFIKELSPPAVHVVVELNQPDILVNLPLPASTPAARPQPAAEPAMAIPAQISIDFSFNRGQVKVIKTDPPAVANGQPVTTTVNLSDLNVKLNAPSLTDPMAVAVTANVGLEKESLNLSYPLSLQGKFQIDEPAKTFKVLQSHLDVGGIGVATAGWMQWTSGRQSWQLTTNIPELKNLKAPPSLLPPGTWSGAILSSIKASNEKGWNVSGNFYLKNLAGIIDMKTNALSAKGQMTAQLATEFGYDGSFKVKTLTANAEMQGLGLTYKDLFVKPANVPMDFSVDASMAQDTLDLKLLNFTLAQLKGSANGRIHYVPGQASNLSIKIPKTALAGFEKILPPLSEMPVQGNMQADVELKGDFNQPMNMTVKIAPILLENVRASVNYKKDTTVVKGPVSVDLRAVLLAEGPNLRSSKIDLNADLGQLLIQMGDMFSKPAGSPIKVEFAGQQKGQKISIRKGFVTTAAGSLSVNGEIQNPQAPSMSLNIGIPSLNLTQVSQMIPMLRTMGLSGSANGKFRVDGTYDFKKGVEKSLLAVSGEVQADLPKFVYKPKPTPPPAKAGAEPAPVPPPEPLLPNWPVARGMDLKRKVTIGTLMYDTIPVEKISWNGRLNKGQLSGEVSVGKVFDGSVDVTQVEMNLTQPAPTLTTAFLFKNLNVGDAFNWAFPTWKNLVKGAATGRMSIKAAHPSRTDFLAATIGQGEASLKNGFLSTVKLDQAVNEKLSKIPGMGSQKLASQGATGDIDVKFVYAKSQVILKSFTLKTPEKNELATEGDDSFVKTDKTMDLKANLHLANGQFSGEAAEVAAANSDAQGRFVVPLRITGNVFSPEFNMTEETIQKIVKRTAEYKLTKAKAQAQKQVQDAAQKEIDKGKQKVQEELSKGLKNLIGK